MSTRHRLRAPRLRGPLRRRRRGRRAGSRAAAARRSPDVRAGPQRARAACCGSSRWSRWPPPRPDRLRPGQPRGRRRAASRPGCWTARDHRLRLGPVEDIAWLRDQTPRSRFARVGVVDPLSADDYQRTAACAGLRRAAGPGPERGRRRGHRSGLRGRGGAGLPRRHQVEDRRSRPRRDLKFVCCNADEGDSGTFADRMLMEGDPFTPDRGHDDRRLRGRRHRGLHLHPLGVSRRGRHPADRDRDRLRAGLARRGHPRLRASLRPVRAGRRRRLHLRRGDLDAGEPRGQARRWSAPSRRSRRWRACSASRPWSTTCSPSAAVPAILADGAEAYAALGVGRSRGTQVFQLAGNIARGGIVETALRHHARRAGRGLRRRHAGRDGRCGPSRSAARSGPTSRRRSSTCRWTTRRSPRRARWSATAGSWSSTTPWTWRGRPGSRWSSAPRSRAASARPAGSGRCAASR